MGAQLSAYPTLPCFTQTVTLGAAKYRVRLTWKERCAGWYIDLMKVDGTLIFAGLRVAAGWGPFLGLSSADAPTGRFLVSGPKEYQRADLGDALQIRYFDADEIEAVASSLGVSVDL